MADEPRSAGKRAEYERLLGPDIHLDQPVNAIALDATWLDEPLQTGDPGLETPLEGGNRPRPLGAGGD